MKVFLIDMLQIYMAILPNSVNPEKDAGVYCTSLKKVDRFESLQLNEYLPIYENVIGNTFVKMKTTGGFYYTY